MAWRDRFRRRNRHVETRDEIEMHLRMAIQDRIAAGESPDEASRNAHREFGSVRATLDDARDVWRWAALEQLLFDARSGAKILVNAPGLSLTVILLVALVIGGNTTIYSAVHAMLTNPAPGVKTDRLVTVAWMHPSSGPDPWSNASLTHYEALTHAQRSAVAAFTTPSLSVAHETGTLAARGSSVSANYFDVLDIPFVIGRGFSSDDAAGVSSGLAVVISERWWRRHFSASQGVVGHTLSVNGHHATVVGVAASPFQGAWLADGIDVWVPMLAFARAEGDEEELRRRPNIDGMIARLAEGATIDGAEAELKGIAAGVDAGNSQSRFEPRVLAYTGNAGRSNMLARFGPRFVTIFSIVTLLTVCIVCANVANLMLARSVTRQREMAVRQSFGASRWRITRLVLAENLTLALAAWGAACIFAYWVSSMLPGMIPASESGGAEVLLDLTPDWTAAAYAMMLALAAALTFTLAPAIRTWRLDLLSFLKAGERGMTQGRARATRILVVVQLALAVVLLVSAGLAYRSLSLMTGRDLGFSTGNLLLVTVDMTAAARTSDAKLPLLQSMLDGLRSVPMIASASYATHPPAQWWSSANAGVRPGALDLRVERNEVGPDFLQTLGVRPLRGAAFDARTGARGGLEAIVNQHAADALWPGESPIGKTIHFGNVHGNATVIGVAPNALIGGYRREERPRLVLVSARQTRRAGSFMTFYIRYHGDLELAVPAVTRALRAAAPAIPVTYVRTLDATLHESTWINRTLTMLLMLFAGGSLFIAALGQYAAMAFAMRQRIRDFAIRMAMGASSKQIMTTALREGFVLTGIGLALGVALGMIAGRGGRALLHGVTPTDAMTYAGVLLVLGVASLAACYVPALRASRVDPIEALRAE